MSITRTKEKVREREIKKKFLTQGDRRLLRRGMKYFGVRTIRIEWDSSRAKYPDIWISQNGSMPKISVTAEWARQTPHERRKRLIHEICHLKIGGHSEKLDKIGFNTHPEKDSFSVKVYRDILDGAPKFNRRKFGL